MSDLSKEIIDNAPEGAERYNKVVALGYLKKADDTVYFFHGLTLGWSAYGDQKSGLEHWEEAIQLPPNINAKILAEKVGSKHSHYFKDVSDLDEIDVYRVCDAFEVNDCSGAIHHAIKKLLCSGQRGAKGYQKDLEEARDSIQRKLDMMKEDGE